MTSKNKKRKLKNSYQCGGGQKHKGKGVKRMSFYTKSERMRLNEAERSVEEALDEFESVQEQWLEWCLDCKHAYKRKNDDDTWWCRLRKRKCPHLVERKEE